MQEKLFEVTKDEFCLEESPHPLAGVWQDLARDLLGEQEQNQRDQAITKFRESISQDPELAEILQDKNLNRIEEEFLVRFLRAGAWQIRDALQVLRSYCNLGKDYTRILSIALPSKLNRVWKEQLNTISEYRDNFGRRVFLFRLGHWDPDTVPVDEFYASAYVLFELIAREEKTQVAGVTCVADVSGLGFKHIRSLGLEEIRCMAAFLTGSFPLWFRRIHVVHHPRIFNILYNMAKPFLLDRVKENIVFHGSEFSELHKEVPPSILPANLGGTGDWDNSAAVAATQSLESYYQNIISASISRT